MTSLLHATNTDGESSLICRYYARGMCRFGHLCRFIHKDPPGAASEPASHQRSPGGRSASGSTQRPSACAAAKSKDPKKWVLAPAFVPKSHRGSGTASSSRDAAASSSTDQAAGETYASVAQGAAVGDGATTTSSVRDNPAVQICPYQYNCPYGDTCTYEHNELCEMCGRYSLHPTDKEQRKEHVAQCIQQHEKDMELSFAIARSKEKTCGICFEVIMEKAGREQRFGILPNCSHTFCLECIRKWRQAKQFENNIIRACPECRIPSDYVCPSAFWVETKDEKEKLITDYKNALGDKDCKYFKKGEGKCPFGNKCFYKHALPGGQLVDVGGPKRNKRKIQRAEDEIFDLFDLYLWDFVDRREFHWLEILSNLSDSGDSDWSDEEIY